MAPGDLQLDLQLKVGDECLPSPMKNGWPHEMASHDSCDTAVGVVAPLPSGKACGAVAGMPDSADTKERICPGPADCPRGEVRAVGFLRGPSSSRRVSPNRGPQYHPRPWAQPPLCSWSALLTGFLHLLSIPPCCGDLFRVHPSPFNSNSTSEPQLTPPQFFTTARIQATLF
jgi:hypothetical protein